MEEPTSADFPEITFPDSITDNPLHPQPPDVSEPIRNPPVIIDRSPERGPEQIRPATRSDNNDNGPAASVLNPSGF
jgi:hypothetical protein